jgi:c-di-GMP-binding flagellar brake protein YcgR
MNNDSSLTEQDFDKFTITGKREIAFILDALREHIEPMTILFAQGAESFITIILDADDETDQVIFDWGGSEEINQRFLKAGSGSLLGYPEGIRVQCQVRNVVEIDYDGRRAFAAELPPTLLRLQRREFFRINVPMAQQPLCTLEGPLLTTLHLPIHGLSIAGLSFTEAPQAFVQFEQLAQIPHCHFDLGEFGNFECGIEVRYVTQFTGRTGRVIGRMGCRFDGLTLVMQAHIQRYMMHVERERRARSIME